MLYLKSVYVYEDLWYAVYEDYDLVGAWFFEDLPLKFKFLLEGEDMPIYQYNCDQHGSFEKMKKIADREKAECPECGEDCLQQLTAPRMVQGGFCDKSMKFSKSF